MKAKAVLRVGLLLAIAVGLSLPFLLPPAESPPPPDTPPGSVTERERDGVCHRIEIRDLVMGTRFAIEVVADTAETARAATQAAFRRIDALEQRLSTWIADSMLSRLNRAAADAPFSVDRETMLLLRMSREHHDLTDGAFDPSVGPLLRLWKPLAEMEAAPGDDAIQRARALVGFRRILLDDNALTVRFPVRGMSIVLGGIAKGFAADKAADAALAGGATSCRVNAGGDVVARGTPPWEPRGFEFEIRDPAGDRSAVLPGRSFHLRDRAVATSGNYERFTVVAGKRYSHILDPRTGRPVDNPVVQVTVIADRGADADALATGFTVLGREKGMALAEAVPDVEALFIVREGDSFVFHQTSCFPGRER